MEQQKQDYQQPHDYTKADTQLATSFDATSLLEPGERVLWQGVAAAGQERSHKLTANILLLVGLIGGYVVGSLLWTVRWDNTPDGGELVLFMFGSALYLALLGYLLVRLFTQLRPVVGTAYLLTDRRVVFVETVKGKQLSVTVNLADVDEVIVRERRDGSGAISLIRNPVAYEGGRYIYQPARIEDIPDVQAVYRLVRQAQAEQEQHGQSRAANP